MTPPSVTPRTRESDPAELRRTATVARHHNMPLVAAALDAAAERIEGLEREVAAFREMRDAERDLSRTWDTYMRTLSRNAQRAHRAALARERAAREALREVGR